MLSVVIVLLAGVVEACATVAVPLDWRPGLTAVSMVAGGVLVLVFVINFIF
jgi:hypothetical protein